MESPILQEFAFCLPADSSLLRADVISGEPIDQSEVWSLGAMATALFISVTIESRTLDRVDAARELWSETARLFTELCESWASIDCDDPSITWLRARLFVTSHFAMTGAGSIQSPNQLAGNMPNVRNPKCGAQMRLRNHNLSAHEKSHTSTPP